MEKDVLAELVTGILEVMKEKIERIMLYGSVARGTDTEESDIDVALIMKEKMGSEIEDKLSDFIVDMNLKYDRVFSVIDIDIEKFLKWGNIIPFYQNINKEGIILWKAA